MKQVIGTTTTYHGKEHPYLDGYQVKIIAVIKGGASDSFDPDDDNSYITDDYALERAGGLTEDDRVEVQPWLAEKGRYSFATSDPRATDLANFAEIRSSK